MKSIIDSLTIEQKEEILKFGMDLGRISHFLGNPVDVLTGNSFWSEELKKDYCAKGGIVDQTESVAHEVINRINSNYRDVPTAEKYKQNVQEWLVRLEEAAKPYRS